MLQAFSIYLIQLNGERIIYGLADNSINLKDSLTHQSKAALIRHVNTVSNLHQLTDNWSLVHYVLLKYGV